MPESYRINDDADQMRREHDRLRVLARVVDTRTRRALAETGIAPGWDCCDVGSGAGFLSAIERAHMSASIGTLRKLARFHKTNILDFFDPAESNSRLVRPSGRKVLEAGPGVRMELLAWGNTVMEPHLFRIAPQAGSGESYTHEGEEFLLVLRGELQLALDGEEFRLKSGARKRCRRPTPSSIASSSSCTWTTTR